MARSSQNTGFACANCGKTVLALSNGSYRNHCPFCLYSLHVDVKPGDRAATCHGLMKPAGLVYHSKKGWQVRHVCQGCGHVGVNMIAEDTVQPDDVDAICKL